MSKATVTPKLRGSKWYARVRWSVNGKRSEKQVPLRTSKEPEAYIRLDEVEKKAKSIASGNTYTFPWMNDEGKTKVSRFTLHSAIQKYLNQRNHIRESTRKRDIIAFSRLVDVLGSEYPVEKLARADLEKFKSFWKGKHKPGGINFNLRVIRTFLRWLKEEKLLPETIKVKMIDIGKPLPKYFSESEFNQIMELDWLDQFYKDAFYFYLTTGCRKSEPFLGHIDGNWLIVDTEESKTKCVRQIRINPEQMVILKEMKRRHDIHVADGMKSHTHIDHYNKVLTKAIKSINKDDPRTLHCLRHTFAVMKYLETRDIYLVKTELGHTSVVMTEKYANFDIRKLIEDFPSLVDNKSLQITRFGDTKSGDTLAGNTHIPVANYG